MDSRDPAGFCQQESRRNPKFSISIQTFLLWSNIYVFCGISALQVGHQISLGKVCIFSTSRPPLVRGTSLTSLHRQALVFPVFVWLSITAASTSGILFSSGPRGSQTQQLATQQKHLNLACFKAFSNCFKLQKVTKLRTKCNKMNAVIL